MTTKILGSLLLSLALPGLCLAAPRSSATWAADFYNHVRIIPNVTYKETPQGPQMLDVFQTRDAKGPAPTIFMIHGGGWIHGSKEDMLGYIMPWMEMGWSVVSINYRIAKEASAPAGVEDCFCALRWTAANAKKYDFDLSRLVIGGASAGGELALVVGMAPPEAGFDRDSPGGPLPRAVAIVNFSGVTDVLDLFEGPHRQYFTADWLGHQPRLEDLARRLSPLTYVRPGLPAIFTAHGDSDPVVPYGQAVQLHAALTKAGVANQLFTVTGGKHGAYTPEQYVSIYAALRAFLIQQHLPVSE